MVVPVCSICGVAENNHAARHPFTGGTNWGRRFMEMAWLVAGWSKDPSTKVGAVIVDSKRRVLGHGYNGFPRGVDDCPDRYADREQKYPRVVHGEMNAILNSGDLGQLSGSTLYVTMPPCCECAKAIIQVGISKVVLPRSVDVGNIGRWSTSTAVAFSMFNEAGVIVEETV